MLTADIEQKLLWNSFLTYHLSVTVLYNNKIRDEDERILYSSIKLKTIVQVTANGRINYKGDTDPNCYFFSRKWGVLVNRMVFCNFIRKKINIQ